MNGYVNNKDDACADATSPIVEIIFRDVAIHIYNNFLSINFHLNYFVRKMFWKIKQY